MARRASTEGNSPRIRIGKRAPSERNDKNSNPLTTWLDLLAKGVVVITALLYIIGRHYTESYYAAMKLSASNLPVSIQDYLFMSTRSLSFLKTALSTSVYSALLGIGLSIVRQILSFELHRRKPADTESMSPAQASKMHSRNPFRKLFSDDTGEDFVLRAWKLITSNLYYVIPSFIVLSIVFLLPGAEESGRVDAQTALSSAPVGEVLVSEPSIPMLTPTVYPTQLSSHLYGYGDLRVIGSLGDQWLFLVSRASDKSSVMSIPESQIISIQYIGTPTPNRVLASATFSTNTATGPTATSSSPSSPTP